MNQLLTERALNNYQSHLAIIQRLYLIGAINQSEYNDSMQSANTLWCIDQKEIDNLVNRRNIINISV